MKKALAPLMGVLVLVACSKSEPPTTEDVSAQTETSAGIATSNTENPLLNDWETPFGIPPFDTIKDEHFEPAFDAALETLKEEIARIADNEASPTFENTIVALETAGKDITRVQLVFGNLTATDTNDTLQALQAKIYPELTRTNDSILLNDTLFARVKTLYENRDPLKLDVHDARLLELTYEDFVRAGANLDDGAKARLKDVNAEISTLTTQFAQNLLAETKSFDLVVREAERLAGLPDNMKNAARARAEKKGLEDAWVFGLDRATFEGFMTFADDRELRKKMFDGYRFRGANGNDNDNRKIVLDIAKLRAERSELLGYDSHAHYQLETRMAKTPADAEAFLIKVWEPGLKKAKDEMTAMQAIVKSEGKDFTLSGEDWWHYAEKLRQQKFAFDEAQVKPYFELNNVLNGAFYVADALFGLSFKELKDVPKWHPNVKVFEVIGENDQHLGVFLADFYSRDSKRGGAWMSSFRVASSVKETSVRPLINNNLNLTPPADGDPTLLSFGQVETLFHEFGHALHGLMTTARYERYAGTSGSPRDFTEFPAQFLEHYAAAPEVLPKYALHYETNEVIPAELLQKLREASTHNQGFKTTEYVAASLLDLAWHKLGSEGLKKVDDAQQFEKSTLEAYGLLAEIEPRYRSPYFAHIFSSPNGYSAGYYAYLWSEILDADGFTAFRSAGNIFDPALASRLAKNVYQAGGIAPADELYRAFRQQDPEIDPLLRIRGLQ